MSYDKKYLVWCVLVVIVLLGFMLRYYHVDYPVIGYHNWKETHYLTEARNFAREGFFKWGFFVPEYDYYQDMEGPQGQHVDTFPITSVVVALLFLLFGVSLYVARLASIVVSVASIVMVFFVVKRLFNNELAGLTAAALTAIMPMLVFFGRNVQLEPYALFFSLLSVWFFLRWMGEQDKFWNLFGAVVFIVAAFLVRYDHFPLLLAYAAVFPYSKLKDRKFLLKVVLCCLVALAVPAWLLYMNNYGVAINSPMVPEGAAPALLLQPAWWQSVTAHIIDNYSSIGFFMVLAGMVVTAFYFMKDWKNLTYRFMVGLLVGVLIWIPTAAAYLAGHSYHQFPAAIYIILMQTMFIMWITRFEKNEWKTIAVVMAIAILFFGAVVLDGTQKSTNRLFDTQFAGLDVAGKYIKDHSVRADKVMHTSGQGYGLLWSADRKGFKLQSDVTYDVQYESQGANWIFIYAWKFQLFGDEKFMQYLSSNYSLRQIGLQDNQPLWFLYQKGGMSNFSQTNEWAQAHHARIVSYERTTGPYDVIAIDDMVVFK